MDTKEQQDKDAEVWLRTCSNTKFHPFYLNSVNIASFFGPIQILVPMHSDRTKKNRATSWLDRRQSAQLAPVLCSSITQYIIDFIGVKAKVHVCKKWNAALAFQLIWASVISSSPSCPSIFLPSKICFAAFHRGQACPTLLNPLLPKMHIRRFEFPFPIPCFTYLDSRPGPGPSPGFTHTPFGPPSTFSSKCLDSLPPV